MIKRTGKRPRIKRANILDADTNQLNQEVRKALSIKEEYESDKTKITSFTMEELEKKYNINKDDNKNEDQRN